MQRARSVRVCAGHASRRIEGRKHADLTKPGSSLYFSISSAAPAVAFVLGTSFFLTAPFRSVGSGGSAYLLTYLLGSAKVAQRHERTFLPLRVSAPSRADLHETANLAYFFAG